MRQPVLAAEAAPFAKVAACDVARAPQGAGKARSRRPFVTPLPSVTARSMGGALSTPPHLAGRSHAFGL